MLLKKVTVGAVEANELTRLFGEVMKDSLYMMIRFFECNRVEGNTYLGLYGLKFYIRVDRLCGMISLIEVKFSPDKNVPIEYSVILYDYGYLFKYTIDDCSFPLMFQSYVEGLVDSVNNQVINCTNVKCNPEYMGKVFIAENWKHLVVSLEAFVRSLRKSMNS